MENRLRSHKCRGRVQVLTRRGCVGGCSLAEPWHYTTALDFVDHWQSLIAGLLALVAAIITVRVMWKVEQHKTEREVDSLRKSLATELRLLLPQAFRVHNSLKNRLIQKTGGQITTRILERISHIPTPIIYHATADKIGLLGNDAMDVVIIYSLIYNGQNGVSLLMRNRDPDNISLLGI